MIPWAHPRPQPKRYLDRFSRFAYCTNDRRVPILHKRDAPPFPLKLPLPMRGCRPHLIHGSLGPPESPSQQHLDRFSRILQRSLLWQAGRPTDRPCYTRSVTVGRIYARSTVMRPKNTCTLQHKTAVVALLKFFVLFLLLACTFLYSVSNAFYRPLSGPSSAISPVCVCVCDSVCVRSITVN